MLLRMAVECLKNIVRFVLVACLSVLCNSLYGKTKVHFLIRKGLVHTSSSLATYRHKKDVISLFLQCKHPDIIATEQPEHNDIRKN